MSIPERKAVCHRAACDLPNTNTETDEQKKSLIQITGLAATLRAAGLTGATAETLRVGTNFACHTGLLPTRENLGTFVALAARIEARTRRPLDILSGGNSASILSMQRGDIPPGINQLRLGAGDELRFAMSYTAVSNAISAPYPMVAVRD